MGIAVRRFSGSQVNTKMPLSDASMVREIRSLGSYGRSIWTVARRNVHFIYRYENNSKIREADTNSDRLWTQREDKSQGVSRLL